MIEVRGPDGSINQFPDGTPDAVIENAMRANYPPPSATPEPQNEASTFDRAIRSPVGVGVLEGASDIANLPRAMGGLAGAASDWLGDKLGIGETGKGVMKAIGAPIAAIGEAMPDPKFINMALFGDYGGPPPAATDQDRYTRAGARGVAGTLGMGAYGPMALMTGAAAGLGSEYAKDQFPDSKWAALLGGLAAGGLTAGTYNFLRPTSAGVARSMLSGIDNTTIRSGEDLQASAIDQLLGPLTPGQAMNNRGMLQIERMTEQSPQGGPMQAMYDQRGPAAFNAVGAQVDGITGGMTPRQGMQAVQAGTGGAIKSAVQARTNAATPFYTAARSERAPEGILAPVMADIDAQIAANGPQSAVGQALAGWKAKLQSTASGGEVSIGQLDTLYKEFRDQIKRPSIAADSLKGADATAGGVLTGVSKSIGEATANASPNIAAGRAAYQAGTPPVDALKKGLVGDIYRTKSLQRAADTFINPANETPKDIYNAANAIRGQDKDALPALVGQYIDGRLQAAAKSTRKDPSRVGGQFSQDIMGELDTNAAQNLEAAIKTLPDGVTRWKAFVRLNDVLRAQGRRLQAGSPTTANNAIMDEMRQPQGAVGAVSRLATGPLRTSRDWLESARLNGNFADLAEIFSSPNSIDRLRELAREPNIRRAEVIVNGMLVTQRAAPSE